MSHEPRITKKANVIQGNQKLVEFIARVYLTSTSPPLCIVKAPLVVLILPRNDCNVSLYATQRSNYLKSQFQKVNVISKAKYIEHELTT